MSPRIWAGCLLLGCGCSVWAEQPLHVQNGGIYEVTISDHEPTRIAIEGDRIIKIFSPSGALEQVPDKDSGEVYVTPTPTTQETELYVKSQSSGTFAVHVHVDHRPGDTLQLIPDQPGFLKPKVIPVPQAELSSEHVERIKKLIKRMILQKDPDGNLNRSAQRRVWKEAELEPLQWYQQDQMRGEVYMLHNQSESPLVVQEAEFERLQPNVLAIAVLVHELAPHQSGRLFLVRKEAQ